MKASWLHSKNPIVVDKDLAEVIGLNEAIALQQISQLLYATDGKDADSANNSQSSYQPSQKAYSRDRGALNRKIESAKKFEVQYGGQKETLVSIIKLANSGDDQATKFLGYWREKSKQNEAVYQFIIKENLAD